VKSIAYLILLLTLAVPSFAADVWRNYGRPYPVRSYITYGDGVLLATASGIRYLTPDIDALFSTVTGLETSSFYAMTLCDEGIFATSEYGLIAGWNIETANWNVVNRSFVSNGVRLIPNMTAGYKRFLVLAFEDRLAFFDVVARRSVLTINKVGKNSLLATPVRALSVHKDTLYVSVGTTLYKRYIDWDHIEQDIRLVDPESWSVEREGEIIQTIAWKGDSLKTFPVRGQWEWDENGKLTTSAQDSTEILVEGKPLTDDILYRDGLSNVLWIGLSNTYAFIVGEYFVLGYDTKKKQLIDYSQISNFTLDGTYEVRPKTGGGVIAASLEGRISHTVDHVWQYRAFADEGHANGMGALSNRMKVLSFLPPDRVFYHIWGRGFYLFSEFGQKLIKSSVEDKNRCYHGNDRKHEDFIVTAGSTVAPDSSGFLTTASTEGGFDLIYVTKDGEFSCANHVGKNDFSGPILATQVEESSDWLVMVSGRAVASYESEGVLEVFRVADPSKRGGRLEVISQKTIPSTFKDAPVDMAYDKKGNYLWIVTKDQITYWDVGNTDKDTIKAPQVVKGVIGAEYTSLEFDVQGNLWVGTIGQGVYRLTRKGVTQDTLTAKQFTAKNGLLSNEVLDIAIDPVMGEAWFSHETGLTMYGRSDLRDVSGGSKDSIKHDIIAYPNPFRLGEHAYITIDNIGEKAVVSIYNRAGHLVRSFDENETKGGSVDWNGLSKRGNVAAPGVYWYIVKNSSGKKKGKFILIH
jgi:hypothetical protein